MAGAGNNKDQRLLDGAALRDRVAEYSKLKPDTRTEAIHDQLMNAIDRSVETHKPNFNKNQINVIRDIVCHVSIMLLPVDKPKGFFRGCYHQFTEAAPFAKAAAIAGTIIFFGQIVSWATAGYKAYFESPPQASASKGGAITSTRPADANRDSGTHRLESSRGNAPSNPFDVPKSLQQQTPQGSILITPPQAK